MLKRIRVEDLTLGMYLQEFCGSWMDHPFWRTKFVLTDPKDLERIRATAVEEVWIDISRGKDVAAACGFKGSSQFGALFHRAVGCSPRAYRKTG